MYGIFIGVGFLVGFVIGLIAALYWVYVYVPHEWERMREQAENVTEMGEQLDRDKVALKTKMDEVKQMIREAQELNKERIENAKNLQKKFNGVT